MLDTETVVDELNHRMEEINKIDSVEQRIFKRIDLLEDALTELKAKKAKKKNKKRQPA